MREEEKALAKQASSSSSSAAPTFPQLSIRRNRTGKKKKGFGGGIVKAGEGGGRVAWKPGESEAAAAAMCLNN